jgi:hypothetical protein
VSFFEPPSLPPEPATPQSRSPDWLGPPDNLVGGVVALELVVAHSQKAAVWIDSAIAYPSGVEFEIEVRWRPEVFDVVSRGAPWLYRLGTSRKLPDELFRAGFQLADGSKVTTIPTGLGGVPGATAVERSWDKEPEGPLLISRGGGGSGQSWSHRLWLWPLPPEGPLSFVCEWPALGITLARAQVQSSLIREAAARSQTLWDDDGPPLTRPGPSPSVGGSPA